ncbi:MAG: hypothetical protein ACTSXP_06940 [Promethearchaeota archaeon]
MIYFDAFKLCRAVNEWWLLSMVDGRIFLVSSLFGDSRHVLLVLGETG